MKFKNIPWWFVRGLILTIFCIYGYEVCMDLSLRLSEIIVDLMEYQYTPWQIIQIGIATIIYSIFVLFCLFLIALFAIGVYDIAKSVINTLYIIYTRDYNKFVKDFGRVSFQMILMQSIVLMLVIGAYRQLTLVAIVAGIVGLYRRRHFLRVLRTLEIEKSTIAQMDPKRRGI